MLNYGEIFRHLDKAGARWLLVDGLNFSLRHHDYLTQDVDVYVDNTPANLWAVNEALRQMDATWGATEKDWGPVPENPAWLALRPVVCVATRFGSLDIFTDLPGIHDPFAQVWARAVTQKPDQPPYHGLCDADMLACQNALPEPERKLDRIRTLKNALAKAPN